MINMISILVLKRALKNFQFNYKHLNLNLVKDYIDFYKYFATIKQDCALANELWCLQLIFFIQRKYVEAFFKLKLEKFYSAWCTFAQVENAYFRLVKHYDRKLDEYNINSIYEYTRKFQKIFPYDRFSSMEYNVHKFKCNICGMESESYKFNCNHKIGELYCGKECVPIYLDLEALSVALVENPLDKCTVMDLDYYDDKYGNIKLLISNLSSPFQSWDIEIND